MPNDVSLSYINNEYIKTLPTPGSENKVVEIKEDNINYKLSINEYMIHNKSSHYTKNGSFYDWVEIYNDGNDVNLNNIYITDNPKNLKKYKLPDKVIKNMEYLVIYLTGGEEIDEVYTNFKLSENDTKIIISNGIKIIDEVEIVKLPDNVSYGKYENNWYYYYNVTPGSSNKKIGLERIDEDGNT